jgi:spermidine synthase
MASFAGDGPLNTDDRPLVIFQAPEFAYTDNEPAHTRLIALIDRFDPDPARLLSLEKGAAGSDVGDRMKAYWMARNRFLRTGVGVEQTANVEQMLGQIGAPLLSIVRLSPDFDAAYNPLLGMAQKLLRHNPAAAKQLLIELEAANPARQEARKLREYISK